MHSFQSTVLEVANYDELTASYPPNKSGNHLGMRAFITEAAAAGDPVEYVLMSNNAADPTPGLRWVPCCEEVGPYYYT